MTNLFIYLLICFGISEASAVSSYLSKRYATASCDSNYIYGASLKCYGDLITLSEIPSSANSEQLRNIEAMCSEVDSSSRCFSREMKPCGDAGNAMASLLKQVFKFTCSKEGVRVLMSSESCWGHETLREEIGLCTEDMELGFRTLSYNDWCDVLESYITCIGEKARIITECNLEAELFLAELVRISVKPTMNKLKCRG